MLSRNLSLVAVTLVTLAPAAALASSHDLRGIIFTVVGLLDAAIPLIFGLALLFFFWGLALFILRAASEEERKKGKAIMIWGIIALFVMLSIFGILRVLDNTFFPGVERNAPPSGFPSGSETFEI